MVSFLLALQFLTIIPLKIKRVDEKKIASSMIYFPLVGMLLGGLLIALNYFSSFLSLPLISVNIILVISLAVLTGGMHLDGLSDTIDGFASGKGREGILDVMKDPRIGAMGALGIFSILLLKLAFLHSIDMDFKAPALILMCGLSRWSLVFCSFLFPYARKDGKARIYVQGVDLKILILAALITLTGAMIFGRIKGIIAFLVVTDVTYLAGKFINKKISGITGDTLGALCELNEVTVLISIVIMNKIL